MIQPLAPRIVHTKHQRDDRGIAPKNIILETRKRVPRIISANPRIVNPYSAVRIARQIEVRQHLDIVSAVGNRIAPADHPIAINERSSDQRLRRGKTRESQ